MVHDKLQRVGRTKTKVEERFQDRTKIQTPQNPTPTNSHSTKSIETTKWKL